MNTIDIVTKYLFQQRLDEVGAKVGKNEEYKKYGFETEVLFHRIKELLPKSSENLLFSLDEANCAQINIFIEQMYLQGLKDGIDLKGLNSSFLSDSKA
jgi:hypothetical protein